MGFFANFFGFRGEDGDFGAKTTAKEIVEGCAPDLNGRTVRILSF